MSYLLQSSPLYSCVAVPWFESFGSGKFSTLVCTDAAVTVVLDTIFGEEHGNSINQGGFGLGHEDKRCSCVCVNNNKQIA